MPDKSKIIRIAQIAAISITALLLLGAFGFLFAEGGWLHTETRPPQQAFLFGNTGTEIMPLPVFEALPDLFPDQFQPGGPEAGDWMDQFGFIHGTPGVNEGLPVGFFLSTRRPRSGAPTPVPFVGANCSLCHTSRIKRSDSDPGIVVHGMGSVTLDFIAWVDAFKTSLLDEKRCTVDNIANYWERKHGGSLGLGEKLMTQVWLSQIRKTLHEAEPRIDEPYGGKDLRNSQLMPNGPSRTQPFRNLVRNIMNRPAMLDRGLCKIPTLYEQQNREWGQFDGTVRNRLTRSVLAAMAVGATIENLILPDISGNVSNAIQYTIDLKGPVYTEIFKDQKIDSQKTTRGEKVYMTHCSACHGYRDFSSGKWIKGQYQGEVIPVEKIGTDAERVSFRYYDILSDRLYDHFPAKHPLKPKREDLRPGPLGRTRGYINSPLEAAFSHTPYLHNGSINTMAELINLKPRAAVFYRGDNIYDPVDLGLVAPPQPDARRYFRFDTSEKGNSNKGHNYPWLYKGPGWNEAALIDLLEYLKTI